MKVLFITTIDHNPGDEFIRLGQEYLFRKIDPGITFDYVHKHDPRTLLEGFRRRRHAPHRLVAPWLYRLWRVTSRTGNKLDRADLVVFAGTPFIFRQNTCLLPCTSANAEWVAPTWGRLLTDRPRTPVMNLAAGTSVDGPRRVEALVNDRVVAGFLRRAVARTVLTTARDPLTADVLARLGQPVPLLPCTSLWAAAGAGIVPSRPEYVALNVMPAGVHRARGNATDSDHWRRTIQAVVPRIEQRHPVLLVCHSADEEAVARQWFPGRRLVSNRDGRTLLRAYAGAIYGVCNRIHGAAAVASMRRPALAVGGDSRADLIGQFGLPVLDGRSAGPEDILRVCTDMESRYDVWGADLRALADKSEAAYLELIRSAFARTGLAAPTARTASAPPAEATARGVLRL